MSPHISLFSKGVWHLGNPLLQISFLYCYLFVRMIPILMFFLSPPVHLYFLKISFFLEQKIKMLQIKNGIWRAADEAFIKVKWKHGTRPQVVREDASEPPFASSVPHWFAFLYRTGRIRRLVEAELKENERRQNKCACIKSIFFWRRTKVPTEKNLWQKGCLQIFSSHL